MTPLPVLVVDDNPLNRSVAVEFARVLGRDAHEAVDGLDAIAKWEQLGPSLILMDLNMPRLNGLLATLRIRQMEAGKQQRRTSIYMWTASGHVTEADRQRVAPMARCPSRSFWRTCVRHWPMQPSLSGAFTMQAG